MPIPEIVTAIQAAVTGVTDGTSTIKDVVIGGRLSIAESPCAWVTPAQLGVPDLGGPDKEWNDWDVIVRVLHKAVPDPAQAEKVLMNLIEPVRAAFRAHIKLGVPNVHVALVRSAVWGFDEVNETIYRYFDATVRVREKVPVHYAP